MAPAPMKTHRICNLLPSRHTERNWRFEDALPASAAAPQAAALPASVDLREDWWSIGDQERTGSCVGWAVADGIARYHMVKSGEIGKPGLLSPRYVWMASKETDQFTTRPETFVEEAGTTLKAAIDILRKYGAVPESTLPFHIETTMYLDSENALYAIAALNRIASYFDLKKNFGRWRQWRAAQGPILAGLLVDDSLSAAVTTQGKLDGFHAETVRERGQWTAPDPASGRGAAGRAARKRSVRLPLGARAPEYGRDRTCSRQRGLREPGARLGRGCRVRVPEQTAR